MLSRLFQSAINAAAPATCLPPHLPSPPAGRTVVIGAGKAAAAMAQAVETHWPPDRPLSGLVVTRYGHGVGPLPRIEVVEAAHPVPDAAGLHAAQCILARLATLTADDLVLCLLSGGGSALLTLPAPGITLADKQSVTQSLLRSGAPIHEINCVRKHLSAIKGGRLAAAAHPARIVSLLISDVPHDDPATIASGPTVPDPTTTAHARAILARHAITPPPAIAAWLATEAAETPKPGHPAFARTQTRLIATPMLALHAAAATARAAGITPLILGDAIEGESREAARVLAAIAQSCAAYGHPAAPPCVLLSGGETTVTHTAPGSGGRNTEFLLALALALQSRPQIHALAADTDGIDGTEQNAGAQITPTTLARAAALNLDPAAHLAAHTAHPFFAALGDLITTGPTRTNVNDFRAILIARPPPSAA